MNLGVHRAEYFTYKDNSIGHKKFNMKKDSVIKNLV